MRVCAICLFMCVCVLCYVCDRAVMSLRVLCWRVKMTSQIFPLTPPTISCSHNWVKTVTYFIQSMIYVSFSLKSHVYIMCLYRCVLSSVCVVYVCVCVCAGRGFNNLSQVTVARHTPSGRLVAVKNTNLDECTEDELLQLMVCTCAWEHHADFY